MNDITNTEHMPSQTHLRFYYMDNVRVIAILMVVLYHIALAYSPMMQHLWYAADTQNSIVLHILAEFFSVYIMPLLFTISGFFALYVIDKRGLKSFLINRTMRIFLPFLIFLPLIIFVTDALIAWAATNVVNQPSLVQFLTEMRSNPDIPEPFVMHHLWFLYYLYLFCLTAALLYKLNFFNLSFIKMSARFAVFIMPLLFVPAAYSQNVPLLAPALGLSPQLWSFGFHGLFFIFGFMLYLNQNIMDVLSKYKYWLLVAGLSASAIYFTQLPEQITVADVLKDKENTGFSFQHLFTVMLLAYGSVYMTLFYLVTARSLFNKPSKLFRFLSDSSYWVYIVHQPLLIYLQLLLLDLNINLWIKFSLVTTATITISLLSYVLLVRWTPIGWLLNGKK